MFPNLRRSQWLALTALLWPLASSANCDKVHYPLSTEQQYIVDAADCKQVLKSVNWFGGESAALTPGGLDKQPMALLINKIKSVGFNSVRLPWANEMAAMTTVKVELESENLTFKQQITSIQERYQQASAEIKLLTTQLGAQTDKNSLLINEVLSLKSMTNTQKDIMDRWFNELKKNGSGNRSIPNNNN